MAKKVKVSEKTVAQLRKGTMASNLAKAKGASPEMKEALIRFYGVKRVSQAGGITDSKRAKLGTLPKKSVDIKAKKVAETKPKSAAQKVDTAVRNVYKYAGPENFVAGGAAVRVAKTARNVARSASVAKNTKVLKTATGSKANLARTKVGYAKGAATKNEVKQAKAAVSKKRGK